MVVIWVIVIFCTILPCILSISSWSLQRLLDLYHFCPLLCPFWGWNIPLIFPIFLKRSLVLPFLLLSSISLHHSLKRPSCLTLLFSETLHLVGCTVPFLPCFLLLSFPWLFVKPPQTTTLPSCSFYFFGIVLVIASSVYNSLGTLSSKSNLWIYLSPLWPSGFP